MEFPNIFSRREASVAERSYVRARAKLESRLDARKRDERNKDLLVLAAMGAGAMGVAGLFVGARETVQNSNEHAAAMERIDEREAAQDSAMHSSDAPPAVTVAHAEAE